MTREAINFSWLVKLRWGAIAGQIVTILGVAHILGVALPLTALFAIIAVEAASNLVCVLAARRAPAASSGGRAPSWCSTSSC